MSASAQKRSYPYPKSRVYLSLVIATLSLSLALMFLLVEPMWILLYAFLTFVITVVAFLLKRRLYAFIVEEKTEGERPHQTTTNHTRWKMLLFAFLMLIGFIMVPLFLAEFLSGSMWFILVVSLTTGVSVSEIILYILAHS